MKCGLHADDSEHSRLLWMAAIERARTVPARNPAGVFLFLVKNRKWDYLSDGHYEAGNARLKAFLHPPMPEVVPVLTPRLAAPRPSKTRALEGCRAASGWSARNSRGQRVSIFAALRSMPDGTATGTPRLWPSLRRGGTGRGWNLIHQFKFMLLFPCPRPLRSRPSLEAGGESEGAEGQGGLAYASGGVPRLPGPCSWLAELEPPNHRPHGAAGKSSPEATPHRSLRRRNEQGA